MNKHEYIMRICEVVASKSTCDRAHVGAVFINKDYEILATGYNGAPRGFPNCDDIGHLMENDHCIRTTHAEENAIVQAAKRGVNLENSILYLTYNPCFSCTKLLINLGVTEIHYKNLYKQDRSMEWLNKAKIKIEVWEK